MLLAQLGPAALERHSLAAIVDQTFLVPALGEVIDRGLEDLLHGVADRGGFHTSKSDEAVALVSGQIVGRDRERVAGLKGHRCLLTRPRLTD